MAFSTLSLNTHTDCLGNSRLLDHGVFSEPQCYDTSDSDESERRSMGISNPPSPSPPPGRSPQTTAGQFGRLSLDNGPQEQVIRTDASQGISTVGTFPGYVVKPPSPGKGVANQSYGNATPGGSRGPKNGSRVNRGRDRRSRQRSQEGKTMWYFRPDWTTVGKLDNTSTQVPWKFAQPQPKDSGYASRENTLPQASPGSKPRGPKQFYKSGKTFITHGEPDPPKALAPMSDKYPGLILQPPSTPISQEQLAAEVKGIYAGLVMVEAKCINIDAAQSGDPTSQLGPEQWQALIALHRTLLYEHHDFLMATQHPSATDALRGLALKYTMPARMWKHGIHAFLEVLRHRRPASQDYMLAFIYLAYQMMALLFETVPTFVDTWIECLGDLARYRMAIEEDREIHATWGGVAAHWYNMASDRHPGTGRLYHHLGILERPSLRKMCFYAKSLTSLNPFFNAKDSLATLCGPIIQDEQACQAAAQSTEARIMTFHAQLFVSGGDGAIGATADDALSRLSQQTTAKIKEWGVSLVVVNIAALLELGSPSNALWRSFGTTIYHANSSSRPSATALQAFNLENGKMNDESFPSTSSLSLVHRFTYTSFNIIIRLGTDRQSVHDLLPSVHAMLVWFHSLYTLQARTSDGSPADTISSLMDSQCFAWVGLCNYLNTLVQHHRITSRTMETARQGNFLVPENSDDIKPLPEDYTIRGLIWSGFYFPSDWFNGEVDAESKLIEETDKTPKLRAERVLLLALYLAFRTDYLKFDVYTRTFRAPVDGVTEFEPPAPRVGVATPPHQSTDANAPTSGSRSSAALSTHSDSDGYAVISSPQPKTTQTYASVVSNPTKARPDYDGVRVVDHEYMEWEA